MFFMDFTGIKIHYCAVIAYNYIELLYHFFLYLFFLDDITVQCRPSPP